MKIPNPMGRHGARAGARCSPPTVTRAAPRWNVLVCLWRSSARTATTRPGDRILPKRSVKNRLGAAEERREGHSRCRERQGDVLLDLRERGDHANKNGVPHDTCCQADASIENPGALHESGPRLGGLGF